MKPTLEDLRREFICCDTCTRTGPNGGLGYFCTKHEISVDGTDGCDSHHVKPEARSRLARKLNASH